MPDSARSASVRAGAATMLLPALAFAQAPIDPARGWDRLWHEYLVDATVIGVAFALVTAYFLVRFRRRSPGQEGRPPRISRTAAVGWALVPAFVFVADDFFLAARGWELWSTYREVPARRLEVKLDAAMWLWLFVYPNGVQSYNELRVPAGRPVMLRMTSRDAVHSFYLPDFRVKEDSMPGRVTYLWFYPDKPGEYVATCAEYCGVMHSKMTGKVIVMPPEQFEQWYAEEHAKLAPEGAAPQGAPVQTKDS